LNLLTNFVRSFQIHKGPTSDIGTLMNYDCTTHPILPFNTVTAMNGYHCYNFTEKLSYEV
jgi:hypothetical protein